LPDLNTVDTQVTTSNLSLMLSKVQIPSLLSCPKPGFGPGFEQRQVGNKSLTFCYSKYGQQEA